MCVTLPEMTPFRYIPFHELTFRIVATDMVLYDVWRLPRLPSVILNSFDDATDLSSSYLKYSKHFRDLQTFTQNPATNCLYVRLGHKRRSGSRLRWDHCLHREVHRIQINRPYLSIQPYGLRLPESEGCRSSAYFPKVLSLALVLARRYLRQSAIRLVPDRINARREPSNVVQVKMRALGDSLHTQ